MQFIYTMKGLGKVYPPDHTVLKDIWLSFLPGAKIGVLGLNGAGKSSLLKIMAGEEQQFVGEAWPADGISVGFLPQEPRLNSDKNVLGNVEEGVAEIKALLTRYDELNARLGEDLSPEQMDKVIEALEESGAEEVYLFPELIHPFEFEEDRLLEELDESYEYLKQYVCQPAYS